MYKEITAEKYKEYFKFENDYKIEGFLVYGAWDVEKYTQEIIKELSSYDLEISSRRLGSFLSDITELVIDGKIYWVGVCYGAAKLSEYTHLACLFESKWVLHMGSAGGLAVDLQALDVVVPDKSFSVDCENSLYKSENDNLLLKKHLQNFFTEQNVTTKNGVSISIQTMMGESLSDILQWSKAGYVCVDMEAPIIMSVSNFFNVPSASVLYISDNLIKEETVLTESYETQKIKRTEVKKMIYSAVVSLIKNPSAFDGGRI